MSEIQIIQGTYSHGKQPGLVMLEVEVFILESLACAVDARRARTVAIEEISSLTHEVFNLKELASTLKLNRMKNKVSREGGREAYYAVELGCFVPLRST